MRSQLYPNARELFGKKLLDWREGTVRGLLLPAAWIPDFNATVVSSIPVGTRIATSTPITDRDIPGGLATGSSAVFPQVFDTRFVSQAVLFLDTGDESTSLLLFYVGDEDLVTAPFIPQGFDYYLNPDAATGGYFRL